MTNGVGFQKMLPEDLEHCKCEGEERQNSGGNRVFKLPSGPQRIIPGTQKHGS
jgi:hypothetical protein